MAKQQYKVGVIGTGNISHTHAQAYSRNEQTEVVAGVDIAPENLAAFRERWGVERGFSDYHQMLAEVRPDIASICTYANLHWEMLEACAEAGVKGIICEKPFLNSPAQLPRVRELVERTGVKIAIGHMRRYGMAHQRARELLLDGEIGEPMLIMGTLTGGGLAEMGSHWIDLLRYFSGDLDVEWVMAQTRTRDAAKCGHAEEDHAVLYMQFAGGAKGVYEAGTTVLNGGLYSLLVGSKGSIQVVSEDDLIVSCPAGVRTEALADVQPEAWKALGRELPEPWWNYKWDLLMCDFMNWLDGGPEALVGFTGALKTTEIYLAGYLSAIRGDRVDLPLADKDFQLDEWPAEVLARRPEPSA